MLNEALFFMKVTCSNRQPDNESGLGHLSVVFNVDAECQPAGGALFCR
jgi:hypothetical protein